LEYASNPTFVLAQLIYQLSSAQIQVGERIGIEDLLLPADPIKHKDLEKFKKTITIFTIPDKDSVDTVFSYKKNLQGVISLYSTLCAQFLIKYMLNDNHCPDDQ